MLVLGLTGNIGCGKSSLSNIFKDNNIDVIDADIISRHIFEDKNLLQVVFNTFGDSIKNNNGTLNRKTLGSIVFNDDKQLKKLNSLTHPRIKEKIKEDINKLSSKDIVVIDGALLIEGKFLDLVDKLIVITCEKGQQISRIINRDRCSIDEAIKKINSQMKQEDKIKYADYIIDNSSSITELQSEANKLINYIKENWCD